MNRTIAVIDDDVYIGDMIERVLKKEGYLVLRAYSGTEALLLLDQKRPDLILLDLMLPGLSGEVILPKISDIPVIVISEKVDVQDKVKLLLNGASDYLTKPFEIQELLARITVQFRNKKKETKTTSIVIGDLKLDMALHEFQPFYFLNQPLKWDALKSVMDCWWRDFGNENHLFWYRQGSEWKSVFIRQILYFRQEKRRSYVVTKTGEDWFYAKWEMIQERLKGHKFFFCHQSYFIHQNYIVGVTNTKLMMENGEEIPISRSKQKEIGAYMSKYK